MGIDNMKSGEKIGVVALSEKVTKGLENDAIRTLKDLSSLLPKDISTEVIHTVAQMTKEQLLEELARCDGVLGLDEEGKELH